MSAQSGVVYGNAQGNRVTNNNNRQPVPGSPQSDIQANGIAKVEDGVTKVDDMVPVFANCCTITSFYCPADCWRMCGAFGQCEFLCVQNDFTCCKVSERPEDCCILQKVRVIFKKPSTCVEIQSQFFCCDHRCALPCNDDVPCMFTVLGLTCFYDYQFQACSVCKSVGDLKPKPPPNAGNRF